MVYLDETGVTIDMTRTYAWGLSGQRVVDSIPRNRSRVLTIAGAIGIDGVRAVMAYEGATTKELFLRFVREALVPALRRGDVVVMDNLRAHYTDGVKDQIEAVGATAIYLPPYSPELNPIEHVWDELREKFFHNRVFKSLDALEDHLALALKTLEEEPNTVSSIVSWPWIIGALLTALMN